MKRLLLLLGVIALAGVVAVPAHALSEPQSTLLRSLSPAELKALIADIDAQGLQQSSNPNVRTGVSRMQIAAGRLASMRAMTTIPVVGTGAVVVWQIADALGAGGFVYKKLTGTAYGGATGSVANLRWTCLGASPCDSSISVYPSGTITSGWYFRADGINSAYWTDAGYPAGSCYSGASTAQQQMCAAASSFTATWTTAGAAGGGFQEYRVTRTDTEMEDALTIEPATASDYSSPGSNLTRSGGTNDTTTPTDLELAAALDRIDPNPGTAGTAVEQDTAEAILDELQPGWAEGFLLQPLPNETYTQYITRLQEAGWVGDATSTELATETPGYGPEAVVRVIATPVGGTTTVYDPLGWPSPSPTIAIDADITIRYNPDSAPEAPTTATPTPITGAPTTIPSAPALDFSPLTDIDFGCKFPYGFLCYAVDVTETFDVSPDAPRFVFDIPTVNVGVAEFGGGEDGWVVDLEVMDDWASIWRDIWSVVIVIGAVYLVATRLLGFKAGGDPGAAMDDV